MDRSTSMRTKSAQSVVRPQKKKNYYFFKPINFKSAGPRTKPAGLGLLTVLDAAPTMMVPLLALDILLMLLTMGAAFHVFNLPSINLSLYLNQSAKRHKMK